MRYLDEQGHRRSVRYRGAGLVVLFAAVALSFASVMPARADDGVAGSEPAATDSPAVTPAPTASPAPAPAPTPAPSPAPTASPSPAPPGDVAPREPLALSSPANDTLFPSSTVTLSGTKDAAGRVEVQSITGGIPYCVIPDSQTWNCTFSAPTGRYTMTVFQYFAGDAGAPEQKQVTIRVLPAPTISGTSPIVTTGLIGGTGFPGSGIVLTGAEVGDCPGIVQPNGFWSCPLAVSASGDYTI
ncbi:hypothetical protein, partial [Salinibacterium sp.]